MVTTPDGVYLRDGRAIPSADHATLGIDNRQSVVAVHACGDLGKGFIGVERRVDVEQGVLELVPLPERLNDVSNGVVGLTGGVKVVCDEQVVSHGSVGDSEIILENVSEQPPR